jgi:hypothetical protein
MAKILHRDSLPEYMRDYYPTSKPWIVDDGQDYWVFATLAQAKARMLILSR